MSKCMKGLTSVHWMSWNPLNSPGTLQYAEPDNPTEDFLSTLEKSQMNIRNFGVENLKSFFGIEDTTSEFGNPGLTPARDYWEQIPTPNQGFLSRPTQRRRCRRSVSLQRRTIRGKIEIQIVFIVDKVISLTSIWMKTRVEKNANETLTSNEIVWRHTKLANSRCDRTTLSIL